jgi:hypothetical protein
LLERPVIASLVTFFVVGAVFLLVVGVGLALIGLVLGLAFALAKFVLLVVLPIALVGYVLVRFLAPRQERLARAGRRFSDGI